MPALLPIGRCRHGVSGATHRQHDCALDRRQSRRGHGGRHFSSLVVGDPDARGIFGVIQLLLGLLWLQQGSGKVIRFTGIALTGLLILGWQLFGQAPPVAGLVYQEDSPYQQVRVRDDDLFRYLVLDRTWHAVMWRADPTPSFFPTVS